MRWIYDADTRGSARQKGIEAVETKYFAFGDSAVILCDGWFTKAVKVMKNDVGAVRGIAMDLERFWKNWILAICRVYGLTINEFYIRQGQMRGQMHDRLIRTKSVKDIHIPDELHHYEDEYIRRHIEKFGFRYLEPVFTDHDRARNYARITALIHGYFQNPMCKITQYSSRRRNDFSQIEKTRMWRIMLKEPV